MNLSLFFKHKGTLKTYKKNDLIYYNNQLCEEVAFVKSGNIAIMNYSLNGNEEIISFIDKGELFANALIFSKERRYLGDVYALSDCELLLVKKEVLITALQKDKQLLDEYICLIAKKTIDLNIKTKMLLHNSIEEKIIFYLENHHNTCELSITLFAKELGIPRPSLSRSINILMREGKLFKNEKKHICLLKK